VLGVSRSAYYCRGQQKFACADEKKKEAEQAIISIFMSIAGAMVCEEC